MTNPPFRAEHIGSFLRPPELLAARAAHTAGTITAAELRARENAAIADFVWLQERLGYKAVTDGEYRRSWGHFDFLEGLGGVEGYTSDHGIQFAGVETKPRGVRVSGKLHWKRQSQDRAGPNSWAIIESQQA